MTPKDRNAAIAAAIILAVFVLGFFFMPTVVLFFSQVSPLLGAGIGALFILAFFAVFWLRSYFQSPRD